MFGDIIPEEPGVCVSKLDQEDQWDDALPSYIERVKRVETHLSSISYLRLAVHAFEMHEAERAQALLTLSYHARSQEEH